MVIIMKQLQMFFDYTCPFCYRGYGYLKELMGEFPQLQVDWRPCEAHPRPETYGTHSDLCVRGMFFAGDHGVDMWAYNNLMYLVALEETINIENLDELSEAVSGLVDAEAFHDILKSGNYESDLTAANMHAWEELQFDAVPSFIMNGHRLDAIPGIGVTKEQLRDFIKIGLEL